MKIFVASLCSSLIQCLTLRYDVILKNVRDDKKVLITSDLHLRCDFSSQTYFGLSYTIFISSFDSLPNYDLYLAIIGLGHWIIGPMHTVLIVLSR